MKSLSHMNQPIEGVWGSAALRMQKAIKMALKFLNQNITLQRKRGHIVNLLRDGKKHRMHHRTSPVLFCPVH